MNTKKKKRIVLLDAHAILHRAYHALPDFSTSSGEPTGALYGFSLMLLKIIDELNPDFIAACFDLPKPTFRKEAYEAYKEGRAKTDEELVAQIIRARDLLDAFGIPWYELEGYEADDLLGTIVKKLKDNNEVEIIIASGDMDTLQLVDGKKVQVYTLRRGIKDTIIYDEKGVKDRFQFKPHYLADYKGLRGDPSDNIPGIAGIGEKTATTLITSVGGIDDIYKKIEKDRDSLLKLDGISERIVGLLEDNEEEARFSKMLSTIHCDAPFNFSLPELSWRDSFDPQKVSSFFKSLDFGSLINRLENQFEEIQEEKEEVPDIEENEVKKVAIALWLVDSEQTHSTLEDILAYANTNSFPEAKEKIFTELKEKNLVDVYEEIELPLIPIIERMEQTGIALDVTYFKKLSDEYRAELIKLEKRIWDHAGEEFNINSPKQLQEVLFDRLELSTSGIKTTSTGQRSTAESELLKLKDKHPIISDIFEYRELQKLLSTYIDVLPKLVEEDGRLHAEFLQDGTTTGRMASQNPNLQNIPIKTELGRRIRNGFVAEKGFSLVAFDYSQIELRIAAMLSGDSKLLSIFKEGKDVHASVASEVFDIPIDEVDKAQRSRAKVINFGILYGMGVNALRSNLGDDVSQKEARKYLDDYFKSFSELARWIEEIKKKTRKDGYTVTHFGRRRYFSGIHSKAPYIQAQAERMAVNAPIQGTQADIIKLAMIRIDEYIEEESLENDARLLLQVHDELVYEIKEKKQKEIAKRIKEIMEGIVPPKETGGITFVTQAEAGGNWGELSALNI